MLSNVSDSEIIRDVLNGNYNKFEVLFVKYHDKIFRYVLRLANYNIHDAEDITSEAFANAYKNLNAFNHEHTFSSWLYRIAHNKFIDYFRKHKQMRFFELEENMVVDDHKSLKPVDVDFALHLLKPQVRSILILVYREGVTIEELAKILNVSKNAATVRLHRIKKQAQTIIKQHYPHVLLPEI